jgi:hypothetical protein
MKEKNYDKPRLVLLDDGSNYGYGSCAAGGNFQCNTGTSFGSGATCDKGQYANATCGSGTSPGKVSCKSGVSANCFCRDGGVASDTSPCVADCTCGAMRADGDCGYGAFPSLAKCCTGGFT